MQDRFPQRSWYQDLGTKISVPKKTESLRGGASQKLSSGARGAAGPPAGGSGGLEAPQEQQGSGGRQPPSKNNFMDPEPGLWDQDLVFFWTRIRILGPGPDIFCSKNIKLV